MAKVIATLAAVLLAATTGALAASASIALAAQAMQPQSQSQSPQSPAPQVLASQGPSPQLPATLAPPYPDTNDPAAMGRWFGQTTHLPAKSILAVTDNAIFAAFPHHDSGPYWTVDVRLESITPQSTAKLGGRSIRLRLEVRCDNNTVRLSFLDVYPGADLTGAPTHRAPPNTWVLPKPNSYVADAVRLACDKTFQGPFAVVAAGGPGPGSKAKVEPGTARGAPQPAPVLRAPERLAGHYAVQIGAYSSAEISEKAWRTLQAAMPDKTSGLSNVTTPVQTGGRILYRTVVKGFPSSAAAATFCQALRTSGRSCLMVWGFEP